MDKILKHIRINLLVYLGSGMLITSLLVKFAGGFYLSALLSSNAIALSWLFLLLSLIFLLMKNKLAFGTGFVSFMVLFSLYFPFMGNPFLKDKTAKGEKISVLQFNVLRDNKNRDETVNLILSREADIVVLEEINEDWAEILEKKLPGNYPYYEIFPREDFFGLAVFSHYPLEQPEYFTSHNFPCFSASVKTKAGQPLKLYAVHSKAPTTYNNFLMRNKNLEALAEKINYCDEPVIVAGDFNAVPWDGAITNFKTKTGLKDSRTSLACTFPSWLPLFKVPIDFIFYSDEIEATDFAILENNFSDHYGIIAAFRYTHP